MITVKINKDELLDKMGDAIGLIDIAVDAYKSGKIGIDTFDLYIKQSLSNLMKIKAVLNRGLE